MATKDSGRRSTRRQTTHKPAESPAPPAAQAPQRTTGRKRAAPRPRQEQAAKAAAPSETASTNQATPAAAETAEVQEATRQAEAPIVELSALDMVAPPDEGEETVPTAEQPEQPELAELAEPAEEAVNIDLVESEPGRRERQRPLHGNALGTLIERQFSAPGSPCRSYSDLERRSGISREALSRYVTARADRRRSPTIDTLVAIADALHLSLDAVCRAAAASVKGFPLPEEEVRRAREEVLSPLVSGLSADQFNAVAELLRLMQPAGS